MRYQWKLYVGVLLDQEKQKEVDFGIRFSMGMLAASKAGWI